MSTPAPVTTLTPAQTQAVETLLAAARAAAVLAEEWDFARYDPHIGADVDAAGWNARYCGAAQTPVFPKQQAALEAGARIHPAMPLVASACRASDTDARGYYVYAARSFAAMNGEVARAPPVRRTHFEQIQQAPADPADPRAAAYADAFVCNPYVDLDLDTNAFPHRSIDDAQALFEAAWRAEHDSLRAAGAPGYDFAWTDIRRSTTEAHKPGKRSRHIVYHLPGGRALRTNLAWGALVKAILRRSRAQFAAAGLPEHAHPGFVTRVRHLLAGDAVYHESIVDINVYGHRRNFRLPDCIKAPAPGAGLYPLRPRCWGGPRCGLPPAPAEPVCACCTAEGMGVARFLSFLVQYAPRDPATGAPALGAVLDYGEQATAPAAASADSAQPTLAAALRRPRSAADLDVVDTGVQAAPGVPRQTRLALASLVARALNRWRAWECSVHDVTPDGTALIHTRSRECPYKNQRGGGGGEHKHNEIYFVAFLQYPTPLVFHYCFDEECATWYRADPRRRIVPAVPLDWWAEYAETLAAALENTRVSPRGLMRAFGGAGSDTPRSATPDVDSAPGTPRAGPAVLV